MLARPFGGSILPVISGATAIERSPPSARPPLGAPLIACRWRGNQPGRRLETPACAAVPEAIGTRIMANRHEATVSVQLMPALGHALTRPLS
jgi:hypothetical protein